MSKWDRVRDSFERSHSSLGFPEAVFENWTGDTEYNPDTGQMEGGEWKEIATIDVEIVPPSVDSTVSVESGTSLGFDTSLRFPADVESDGYSDEGYSLDVYGDPTIVVYGEDAEKPTRVTVEGITYEVQGDPTEHGSGMVMLRVTEK